MRFIAPLLIQSKSLKAAIHLCILKAHASDNLDDKTECGSLIREILEAIDSCIRNEPPGDSVI
jgi:hypothetical protein